MRKFFYLVLLACGGGQPTTSTPTVSSTAASSTPVASVAPSATDAPLDDPNESQAPITLAPLVTKGAKVTYPKSTVADADCWKHIALAGDNEKDFDQIVKACGTPTGLVEYAKPVHGKLHHIHDQRDVYVLKLLGSMCYRYFAVGDGGIKDLDILVLKKGALVADDKTTHPVAIVEFDKTWCMDSDEEYEFSIQVDGVGKGGYTFGVWTRLKK